jgi:serine/threonine protein kinase
MMAPALDLLDLMLELDPSKRISAEDALKCAWLANIKTQNILPPKYAFSNFYCTHTFRQKKKNFYWVWADICTQKYLKV